VHAIVWTVIHHNDTGIWLPRSGPHWLAVITPFIALGCTISFHKFMQHTQKA
jgi:hypothetical protein